MASTTARETTTPAPASTFRRLLWVAPAAALLATAADLVLYAAAGHFDPAITAWPGAGAAQIAAANCVYLLIGAAALLVVARIVSRPAATYSLVATLGLLLSLALPISAGLGYGAPDMPAPDAATAVTLAMMHIVTYAISLPMFIYLALPERDQR